MIILLTILIPALILSLPIFNLSIIAGIIYLFILVISFGIGTNFQTLCLGKKSRLSPIFSHWVGICTSSVILSISFYLKIPAWIILILLTLWSATGFIRIFQPININSTDKIARSEIFPILLCSLVSVIWCIHEFQGLHFDGSVYKFTPWLDNFYHAVWVDEFSRYIKGFEPNDPRASGVPTFLYHIGQYAIPSLAYTFGPSISSIDYYIRIATPLAFFVVGGAGYSLSSTLRNNKAGIISLILLLCIPYADIGHIRSGWFNFYWLILIHPSLGFGIAGAALTWICLLSLNKRSPLLKISVIYLSSTLTLFLKAHILIVNGLAFAISPLVLIRTRVRIPLTLSLILALFTASIIANWLGLPVYNLDGSGFKYYVSILTGLIDNETIKRILEYIITKTNPILSYFLFIPIITVISFGPISIIALLLFIKHSRRCISFGILVVLGVITYISFATFGGAGAHRFGTPEELMHRIVVWPQFLLCVLTSIYLLEELKLNNLKIVNKLISPFSLKYKYILLGLFLLLIPTLANQKTSKSVNNGSTDTVLPPGLVEIGQKLKKEAKFDEIALDAKGDPDYILRSISGIRSYYHRSNLYNHRVSDILQQRLYQVDYQFKNAVNNNDNKYLLDWLRSEGITYVVIPPTHKLNKLFLNSSSIIFGSNGYMLIKTNAD